MQITVLNGSPKGEISVTLQYVRYLQKAFPEHQFKIFHIAQSIRQLEKEPSLFEEVIAAVAAADGVLWAFPLYIFLVHADYKRFIELIRERGAAAAFRHKYAAALSTSIHFYDHTAHNYIQAVCDDLEMKYTGYFAAEMDDLLKEELRKQFHCFAAGFFHDIAVQAPTARRYQPLPPAMPAYLPGPSQAGPRVALRGHRVVIVADAAGSDTNLGKMLAKFESCFSEPVERLQLDTLKINGGCLGCIRCGYDNVCVYGDSDDVRQAYQKLEAADIVVYAGTIVDRYFSSRWKLFIDRRFEKTHQPLFTGKQFAYIISGPLSQLPNLTEILHSTAEYDRANLAGVVTDEAGSGAEIDALLADLAERLVRLADQQYVPPATFRGVAATVIFRDAIWGRLRFVFQGDHRYFKRHGFYDFPQQQWGQRFFNGFMTVLFRIPPVRRVIQRETKQQMIAHFQKVLKP
ncbi:NADPH-dependent FMN reductase [Hydrogenispora ethanolica]|jgi:multimeric flavodoxin WrbA|uniref:NADPH-dependent FMN reductase n=1 Tax=Hydrogenispora ethanolica TaxID=1082276 RepID=A0A4R1SA40_HYDET|nr:NAD(P)H-dependent oxidoreductase [Hydrogenispora ethanolica]TCL76365.1 NADPH-dependent FMN reductase [Hydrogenispora ethanolica]